MKRRTMEIAAVAALVLLAAALSFMAGQGAGVRAQERTAVTGTVAPLLQYQGRLSDPQTGGPLADGEYTMTFRLYSAPTGGTAAWTETKDVPVQGGLFSTVLGDTTPLDQGLFSGQALYLGVKVGSDAEAAPRQQVLPVAYALGLVPGAEVQAASTQPALTLGNSGTGLALEAKGPVGVRGDMNVEGSLIGGSHNHSNYVDWYSFDSSPIIYREDLDQHTADAGAHHSRYTDAEAAAAAENSPNIVNSYWMGLHESSSSAHHSRYSDSEAVNAVLAADGSGSGLDADKLDGKQANDFAATNHGHSMLPIAYGVVNADGLVFSSSHNISVELRMERPEGIVPWYFYDITIASRHYDDTFVTVVTPHSRDYIPSVYAQDGKLRITFGAMNKARFQFVTFKP